MTQYPQYQPLGLVALLAGGAWLATAAGSGILAWVIAVIPGLVLLSTGVGSLLYAGDPRLNQFMALAGVLGCLLAVPYLLFAGLLGAVVVFTASAIAALTSGYLALAEQPDFEGIERPPMTRGVALKAMLDNALIGYFTSSAKIPIGARAQRVAEEVHAAAEVVQSRGWADKPDGYHRKPAVPDAVRLQPATYRGEAYQHVTWDSGFTPHADLPGAERYAGFARTQTMHAWMLRHDDGPEASPVRPWLMAIHGYRMGIPWLDMSLFPPAWLHHRLGFNVLMPVLPLHGPRRAGLRSGDKYLDGDFLNLIHAQTQALHDLRSAAAWLKAEQDAQQLGLLGYSLGGFNAALLASYSDAFDVVISGIPLVDIADALWRNFPDVPQRGVEALGINETLIRRLLQPLSPLAASCRVPKAHRYVFAGTADQLLPPPQAQALARHWGCEPRWFVGSHLSVRHERVVKDCIEQALAGAGLIAGPGEALVPAPV